MPLLVDLVEVDVSYSLDKKSFDARAVLRSTYHAAFLQRGLASLPEPEPEEELEAEPEPEATTAPRARRAAAPTAAVPAAAAPRPPPTPTWCRDAVRRRSTPHGSSLARSMARASTWATRKAS
eukprot:4699531-Prymnesium_polylepis.2